MEKRIDFVVRFGCEWSGRGGKTQSLLVRPENCKTALGKWLAENLLTLERCDDFSSCRVVADRPTLWPADMSPSMQANMERAYAGYLDKPATLDWYWPEITLGKISAEEYFDQQAEKMLRSGERLADGRHFGAKIVEIKLHDGKIFKL